MSDSNTKMWRMPLFQCSSAQYRIEYLHIIIVVTVKVIFMTSDNVEYIYGVYMRLKHTCSQNKS